VYFQNKNRIKQFSRESADTHLSLVYKVLVGKLSVSRQSIIIALILIIFYPRISLSHLLHSVLSYILFKAILHTVYK